MIKPSNILLYPLLYPALEANLSDLGRACCKMIDTPQSEQAIAGDPDYAPPELLYGKIDPNWHQRRLGVIFICWEVWPPIFSRAKPRPIY
jgi:eukaryotic-like serine/threonine-protein kinase